MSNVKSELVDNLEHITEYCNDSIKGYREAADAVRDDNPSLASQWEGRAEARKILSERLSERLRCLGEEGESDGTAKGAIHRGMLKLKSAFTSDDVQANIKECLRGEEELRDKIDHCLKEDVIEMGTLDTLKDFKLHVDESIKSLKALKK